ncbi:MAG: hypothetical protein HDQ95_13480, partial [Roseburia sp.]|nr:hypothetical protein [Roseburia sp.]
MWKKCLAFVLTTMLVLPAHVPTALYAAGTVNAVEEEMDIVSTEMLLEEQIDTEELELEKNIGLETQNAGENVGSEKPERKSDEADLSDSDTMIIEKETEILSAADSDMTVLNDKMESHSYNASNTENIMVDFAGGDGTKENPYQVATAEQLNAVRNNLEACYIQVNDIDMSSWGNWEPIAAGTESFKGAYDGGNYCIWNLSIEENANTISGGSSSYGLFARGGDRKVSAQIKNVKLCNLNISVEGTGAEYLYVGGVVGESKNTYISNCSVSGKITILEYGGITVGGIAGLAEVEKCTNKANLCIKKGRGSAICGGVIGEGSCINSENYGNIERSGSEDATCGGIMGQGSCINSKNYGNIEISAGRFLYTGGIVGNGSAEYCTNYANVEGHVTSPSMSSQTIGWYNCFVGGIEGVGSLAKYCTNYGDVAAYNDKYSSKYVNTQSSAGGIVGGQHKQVFGTRNQVINCINWGENIVAEGIPDVQFYYKTPRQVGRITGDSDYILNCYSVGATLTNGELPTENIGTDKKNGATIIESGTADLDAQTVINFGSDSASLNKAMSGESGSVIDAVLVLKSNVYTIDDLTIISSNSNVAEIDHIEKDTGAYVPSLDGSE